MHPRQPVLAFWAFGREAMKNQWLAGCGPGLGFGQEKMGLRALKTAGDMKPPPSRRPFKRAGFRPCVDLHVPSFRPFCGVSMRG